MDDDEHIPEGYYLRDTLDGTILVPKEKIKKYENIEIVEIDDSLYEYCQQDLDHEELPWLTDEDRELLREDEDGQHD